MCNCGQSESTNCNCGTQEHNSGNYSCECYWCGRMGHMWKNPHCSVRGITGRTCSGRAHFEEKCQSKWRNRNRKKINHMWGIKKKDWVRQSETGTDSDNDGYIFHITWKKSSKVPVTVGGVEVNMVIDSGSDTYIIDQKLGEKLKSKKIKCQCKKNGRKLFTCTSTVELI